MATREEKYSTCGRAHLLFEMLQGNTIHNGWQSEEVREALDLCLSCKACKTECPVNVDMATWKSEFLAHHYEHRAHPLHHYAFGFMDRWASMAAIAPRLANLPGSIGFTSSLIHRLLHIAPDREIPRFASKNFRSEWNRQHGWKPANNDATVLLWPDTWNNYFQPAALHAAHRVLEQTGARVSIPQRHVCCGRPLYDFGFLDAAKRYLSDILDTFAPQIAAGVPVVMLEPSCASVFRDELVNFFPNDARAQRLAKQTTMLSQYVEEHRGNWHVPDLTGRRLIVQGHCHQKSLMTMQADVELMRTTGADVDLLDSGCCGMAGPFGFEAKHYDVSQALAERVLLPAVRSAHPRDVIVANGFSCREAVAQNGLRRAVHLSQVLAGEV
jgi:Fe-S oxidoreductase